MFAVVFQVYVLAPPAVSVADWPIQITFVSLVTAVTVGLGFTVTFTAPITEQLVTEFVPAKE